VNDLAEEVRAFVANGLGDLRKLGNAARVVTVDPLAATKRAFVHPHRLENDQRGTPPGAGAVVFDVPIGRHVVETEIRGVGRHEYPIAQRDTAQLKRLEDMRISRMSH